MVQVLSKKKCLGLKSIIKANDQIIRAKINTFNSKLGPLKFSAFTLAHPFGQTVQVVLKKHLGIIRVM